MKTLYRLLVALFVAGTIASCGEEDKKVLTTFYAGFETSTLKVSEADEDLQREVSVYLAAPLQTKDVSVTLSYSGGVVGTDFSIEAEEKYKLGVTDTEITVVVPAGELFSVFSVSPIDNLATAEGGVTEIEFEITNAESFLPGLGLQGKKFTYTIQDNDCPFDLSNLAGNYDVQVCSSLNFYFAPGCNNSYTTSLSVGSEPNTLLDSNIIDSGNSTIITINPTTLSTFLSTQFAYNNAAGLARNVGTEDLSPGSINTCAPSFTLNFYIIDNTGAKRTVLEATYTKQ